MFSLRRIAVLPALLIALLVLPAGSALAARCGSSAAGFNGWLAAFQKEAVAKGISPRVAAASLNGVTYNNTVIRLDRSQKAFKQSFQQFAAQRVTAARLAKARQLMKTHARTLAAVERRYGVPPQIIVAIWGLETDFGVNRGNMPVMRSLATLAYDCRRSSFFTNELMSALKIVQRGDMAPSAMRGAWAGELGQTQFLASNYLRFAVDFDGNGRRDLIRSVPDALGSTGNYLKSYGWRRGGGWNPGSSNFSVLKQWNKSSIYQQTIALFASKL